MKNISLTLCMIAKDEADVISDCLESVNGLVEEVILVDTGSTDGTPDMARSAGARVFHFDWNDDFSAARNESLKHAAGEWILVLDADEVIDPADHARIRDLLTGTNVDAYRLVQRSYQQQATLAEWVALATETPLARGCPGYIRSPLVRLFRNLQPVRFRGRVHEIVEHDLIAQGRPIADTDIPIHHYGKILSEERMLRKQMLYRRIGEKILAEDGQDCRTLSDLGVQYLELNQNSEAVQVLQAAHAINPEDLRVAFNLAVGWTRLGRTRKAAEIYRSVIRSDPTHIGAYNNLAHILQQQPGTDAQVENLYAAALGRNGGHPLLYYNYGLFLEKKGLHRKAKRQFQLALAVNPEFSPAMQRNDRIQERSHPMMSNPLEKEVQQGEALFRNGAIEDALALFDRILEKSPEHVPALNNKGVALNRLGRHRDAEETLWKVLAIDENNTDAVYNLLLNYLHEGQFEKVNRVLEEYGHTLSASDIQDITRTVEAYDQSEGATFDYDSTNRRVSEALKRRLFFVMGVPRSGTTWMQQLLNSHPEVLCIGEEDFNKLLIDLEKVVNDYNAHMIIVNKDMGVNEYTRFTKENLEYLFVSAMGSIFSNLATTPQVKVIGSKNPVLLDAFKIYAHLIPSAKFIHMIRDGRDVLTSAWHRNLLHSREETLKRWPEFHDFIAVNSAAWASNIRNTRSFGRTLPNRYFELRYEDLHQHPEPVFQKILTFLGVDDSIERAAYCCKAASFEKLSRGRKRGQEDPSAFFRKGIIGDWKNRFDTKCLTAFMESANPLLIELGYE